MRYNIYHIIHFMNVINFIFLINESEKSLKIFVGKIFKEKNLYLLNKHLSKLNSLIFFV